MWLLKKVNDQWSQKINLSKNSTIKGGYFYWWSATELYFQASQNNGDLVLAKLINDTLDIVEELTALNTKNGSEFSPYVDKQKRFIIFTRYVEGDASQQGFFISYNSGSKENPKWESPQKITSLPYGWSPNIINNFEEFVFTDGENIRCVPISTLRLNL